MRQATSLGLLVVALLTSSCAEESVQPTGFLGQFDARRDLLLPQFDLKTDVDDVHSIAAVATMLADPRFAKVQYHAVAGAYGTQGGAYVPANDVLGLAFGERWSDAHADYEGALEKVASLVVATIHRGGRVWIADGGQSDFSAAVVRATASALPDADLKDRIHIVQHADWNEEVTTPADLSFVKDAASYHKIPDGNAEGNGTPGFRSDKAINWQQHVSDPRLRSLWEAAIATANTYNGAKDRYLNESIRNGGLDFSDTVETAWIFGFDHLDDGHDFFREFATHSP